MPLGPQLMRTLNIGPAEFGLIVSSYTFAAGVAGLIASSRGGSLTGLTVTVKEVVVMLFAPWPSLTERVIVAVPKAFAAGANVNVPLRFGLV